MGTVIPIPEYQTIRPKLDFSPATATEGYASNQHENDNFIRKNALNAEKFNEYERLIYTVCNKIGGVEGAIFSDNDNQYPGTIGSALDLLNARVNTVLQATGETSKATAYNTWAFGGNVYYDKEYTKGETDETAQAGFYPILYNTNGSGHDHQLNVHGGLAMIGNSASNIGYYQIETEDVIEIEKARTDSIYDVTGTENDAALNALSVGNGESYAIGASPADYMYLEHKHIKTDYFTNTTSPGRDVTVVVKVSGQANYFYEHVDNFVVDIATGKIIFSTAFKSTIANQSIAFFYAWYQYRKDLVYINNDALLGATGLIYRRGQSYDTLEESVASKNYATNGSEVYSEIDPWTGDWDQARLLLFELYIYPKNALDEETITDTTYRTGAYYSEATYTDNMIDHRVDASQSIVKWQSLKNGIVDGPTNLIYADGVPTEDGNKLRVNVLPHNCIIDGRHVKTRRVTLDLTSGASKSTTEHRIVAICADHTGAVTTSDVNGSTNNHRYPATPALPLRSEDRDGVGGDDLIPYQYDTYIAFVYIPKDVEYFEDCFVYYNKMSNPDTYVIKDATEASLIVSLYDAGIIPHYEIQETLLDSVVTQIAHKEYSGETGRYYTKMSIVNYLRMTYTNYDSSEPDTSAPWSIPDHITTIKYIEGVTQTTWKGDIDTSGFSIPSGKTFSIVGTLSLGVPITLGTNSSLVTRNGKIQYTSGYTFIDCGTAGTEDNIYIDAEIDVNNQFAITGNATNVIKALDLTYSTIKARIEGAVNKQMGIDLYGGKNNIIEARIANDSHPAQYGLNRIENNVVQSSAMNSVSASTANADVDTRDPIDSADTENHGIYYKGILKEGGFNTVNTALGGATLRYFNYVTTRIDHTYYGAIIHNGNITRSGTSTLNGAVTCGSNLIVGGTTSLNGSLSGTSAVFTGTLSSSVYMLSQSFIATSSITVSTGAVLRFTHNGGYGVTDPVMSWYSDVSSLDSEPTSPNNYDGIGTTNNFGAEKVFNAWWNDIADFQPVAKKTLLSPGCCYFQGKDGLLHICKIRCQAGVVGIYSDTYGFGVGNKPSKECKTIPVGVAGFVLAYVDDEYDPGTPLVNDEEGRLTKASLFERIFYAHRIVGTYHKKETKTKWGSKNKKIKVNKRHWVKII